MRLLLLPFALLAPLPVLAQVTPVAPIEKGTALPPPSSEEAAVLARVQAMHAGIAARNPAAALAPFHPQARTTVAVEQADGARHVTTTAASESFAGLVAGSERFEQRMATPAIEIDGDIAMVWAPYTFLIDGKAQSCGVEHVDLVREKGVWKILNLTSSHRTTGCAQ